jgi:type VI protein secretion system component Hcp
MGKKLFSWGKVLPVLGISMLAAALVSFIGTGSSSAYNKGDWDGTRYTLDLAGVTGTTSEARHMGGLELNSYRFLEDMPAGTEEGMTAAAEAADFGDNNLRFLADSGKISPALFAKAASGEKIADAVLKVRKADKSGTHYMTYKMTDLVVTSYQTYGNDEDKPVDEVVLSYATLEMTHNEGTPYKKGWSFKEDKNL